MKQLEIVGTCAACGCGVGDRVAMCPTCGQPVYPRSHEGRPRTSAGWAKALRMIGFPFTLAGAVCLIGAFVNVALRTIEDSFSLFFLSAAFLGTTGLLMLGYRIARRNEGLVQGAEK